MSFPRGRVAIKWAILLRKRGLYSKYLTYSSILITEGGGGGEGRWLYRKSFPERKNAAIQIVLPFERGGYMVSFLWGVVAIQ